MEKRGIKESLTPYRYQRRENNKREEKFLLKGEILLFFPKKKKIDSGSGSAGYHYNPIFVSIFVKRKKRKKERKDYIVSN